MRILVTATTCAALALSACGNESTDQADESPPPPATTEQPAEPTSSADANRPLPELVAGTEDVLGDVAGVARRLQQDPNADVSSDLTDIRDRARTLAEEARAEAEPLAEEAQQQADQAQDQADELQGQAERELSTAERRELREELAQANERAAKAADRLERVTDPADAADVVRSELRGAEADLSSVAERLRGDVPPDVRERIDELEQQLGSLGR